VGDSPIYLIRNDTVEIVSTPHTWAAEHAAIAPEGAKPLAEKFQHMLTRAMGVDESAKPDTREIPMDKGDIVVICSDGLSDNVSPEEIRDIVIKADPDQASQSLVDLSNERGGHDNITVVVLKIEEISDDITPLEMDEPQIELEDELSPPETDEPIIEWADALLTPETDESPIELEDEPSPSKMDEPKIEWVDALSTPETDEPQIELEDELSPPETDEPQIELEDEPSPPEMDEPQIDEKDDISPEKTKIAVEFDTEDGSYRSFVLSISLDSVFIETVESFTVGQEIMLSFSTDDEEDLLMVSGSVVNRIPKSIEVKFEDLSSEDQETIKTLVDRSG
jgi:Tfp pilus assembly protein PilZ